MKVIDLLNKIAKGKKVPKRVIYRGFKYKFHNNDYYDEENDNWLFRDNVFDVLEPSLNDEVEILEKKIPEELKEPTPSEYTYDCVKKIYHKINEIIDYLKSKGDE